MNSKKNLSPMDFILESCKPFKFWILGQFTVGLIWAIDLSLRPYILKIMLDRLPTLTKDTAISELQNPAIFYVGLSLLMTVAFRFYDFVWLNLNPKLKRQTGQRLMHHMMQHSISLFQNTLAGNLGNKIKDVMSGIPDLLRLFVNHFRHSETTLIWKGISENAELKKGLTPGRPFAFFIKNSNGDIKGGCSGYIFYGCLYVDLLWVDQSLRGKKYGVQLMENAEKLARESKCHFIAVNTMDFEALDFYKKLGFIVEFERRGFEKKSIMFFLKKDLQ